MVLYNFKAITPVPTAAGLVDNVLSSTQRKTPTVVHRGYSISRIREFYLRKVKYCAQAFHDKLSTIVSDFPQLNDLHPFHADLMNVLYDRDHLKLALGQLATARALVDGIARDYARLLKYSDSLFRAKQLKRAAMGRMATLIKRHAKNLEYLESVRQHMARLPAIDPATRTLLIAGFPNVGKSSFVNKVTRADLDVQPYAFTTKSLFVGHTDHKYLRWQVIDTPGILDHELEDRNTIEMQSITALAHLRACILFFIDPSEQCGYTLEKQLSLFKSISPLFANKPIVVVANKTDLGWEDELDDTSRGFLAQFTADGTGATMLKMSAHDETGVMDVKNTACDMLLEARVEAKVRGRKAASILNRLHVAMPKQQAANRGPNIPPSVQARRAAAEAVGGDDELVGDDAMAVEAAAKTLERDIEAERGGPGVYSMDWRKLYKLREKEFAYDIIPEIVDGKNIADFVDPDVEAKLEALEREEDAREAVVDVEMDAEVGGYRLLSAGELETVRQIKEKKALLKGVSTREKGARGNRSALPRNKLSGRQSRLEAHLEDMGMPAGEAAGVARRRASSSTGRLRATSASVAPDSRGISKKRGLKRARSESVGLELARSESAKRLIGRSVSRPRSVSVAASEGYKDGVQRVKAGNLARKKMRLGVAGNARRGDADRHVPDLKPKHLNSGKRGIGKTDRR
jgi:nucleolar GTP-binding protein